MADVNTDETVNEETTVVEETTAPKKVTGKLVKEKFVQLGSSVDVRITPIDDSNERILPKTLVVAFGEEHTHRLQEDGSKTDEKVLGRYQVSLTRMLDEVEDVMVKSGVSASKTIELAIKDGTRGTVDDYEVDADYEAEFFKQKVVAEKVDLDDVWTDRFKDVKDDLFAAAGEIEGLLDAAQGSQVTNQDDYLKVAHVLIKVRDILKPASKSHRHAMQSWAKGGIGSNHPLLKKFGNGINALTEAMRLAELTAYEYSLLPASQTSGKSIDGHKSASLAALAEKAGAAAGANGDYNVPLSNQGDMPDAAGAAQMVRLIAKMGFDVDSADSTDAHTLVSLVETISEVAREKAAIYNSELGKHVNTYDAKELAYARITYGRMFVSTDGHNLFADAIGQIQVIAGLENKEQTDEVIEKTAGELKALFTKNAMMRQMLAATQKKVAELAKDTKVKDLMKLVEDDETGPTKPAMKGFGAINQAAAAGHLYKLMATRDDAIAVYKLLQTMVTAHPFADPKVVPVADAAE